MRIEEVEAAAARDREGTRTDLDNLPASLPESEAREKAAEAMNVSPRSVSNAKRRTWLVFSFLPSYSLVLLPEDAAGECAVAELTRPLSKSLDQTGRKAPGHRGLAGGILAEHEARFALQDQAGYQLTGRVFLHVEQGDGKGLVLPLGEEGNLFLADPRRRQTPVR